MGRLAYKKIDKFSSGPILNIIISGPLELLLNWAVKADLIKNSQSGQNYKSVSVWEFPFLILYYETCFSKVRWAVLYLSIL